MLISIFVQAQFVSFDESRGILSIQLKSNSSFLTDKIKDSAAIWKPLATEFFPKFAQFNFAKVKQPVAPVQKKNPISTRSSAPTAITAFLDEDTLSSDSATGIASQQSIKAYVDNQVVGAAQKSANSIDWVSPSPTGALESEENDQKIYTYQDGLTNNLVSWLSVPTGYTAGDQIFLVLVV